MKYSLDTNIQYVKYVGPKAAEILHKLGIYTVEDLLTLAPKRYVRRSLIKDINVGEEVVVTGRIIDIGEKYTNSRNIFYIKLYDGTGNLFCYFFNYSERAKKKFNWHDIIEVEGKVDIFIRQLQMVNPIVRLTPTNNKFKYLPIYPLTQGITNNYLRKILFEVLNNNIYIHENLPDYILEKERFISRAEAFYNLHLPENINIANYSYKRLEFEEIFYLQLFLAKRKNERGKGIKLTKGSAYSKKLYNLLKERNKGFELTKGQIKALNEIFTDMESGKQMNRLLQGDVGCGKTIVALFSMLKSVDCGYQSVLMAPTEVLAEQHFYSYNNYLSEIGVKSVLLIGSLSQKEKEKAISMIKDGSAQIIFGTHALIEEKVKFHNLCLVVIDEQHKFGVMQRKLLMEKGISPHILVMTATPIPRSLYLVFYGDLDESRIYDFPTHISKTKVITRYVTDEKISYVYEFIKGELSNGYQCYVVYPVIEESELLDIKSAIEGYEELKNNVFKDYNVGLLHGRLSGKEKISVMEKFAKGEINILVSTTVIEVGIDVPNANCMVIMHAERFGIAQLHQLRGRIRRGAPVSYCILVSAKNISEEAKIRIESVEKEIDGFKLAELDMKLRGPGELLGVRQHGFYKLKFANLFNTELLSYVREIVFDIVKEDKNLMKEENKVIKRELNRRKFDLLNVG